MFTAGSLFVRRLSLRFLALALLTCGGTLHAQLLVSSPDAGDGKNPPASPLQQTLDEVTPVNELTTQTTYVGVSPFHQKEFRTPSPLAPDGRQTNYQHIDELENSLDFAHRFHLFDQVYLKLGASYERYDFGTTDAPLPSTLQDINGVVALEYVVHGHTAAFIKASPGVYFSQNSHIDLGSVDVPTAIGSAFKVPFLPKVYGLAGINISVLSRHVVDPILGVIWLIRDDLRLQATPPTPRLIYNFNDRLDLFVGGEVLGQSYHRDANDDYRPQFKRFSGGVIDLSESRLGGGFTYKPCKGVEIEANGGWDLGITFDYYRGAGKRFTTEGAPYAEFAVSAEF